MKICETHWSALKQAIDDRGLSGLVSKDGHVAVEKAEGQLQGDVSRDTFDPLMNANFAIWSNGLRAGGLYLMGQKDDGTHYCPICESEAHGGQPADWWINSAADEQLERARALGLAPLAS